MSRRSGSGSTKSLLLLLLVLMVVAQVSASDTQPRRPRSEASLPTVVSDNRPPPGHPFSLTRSQFLSMIRRILSAARTDRFNFRSTAFP
jgi:hypothetical protein